MTVCEVPTAYPAVRIQPSYGIASGSHGRTRIARVLRLHSGLPLRRGGRRGRRIMKRTFGLILVGAAAALAGCSGGAPPVTAHGELTSKRDDPGLTKEVAADVVSSAAGRRRGRSGNRSPEPG